MQIQRIPPLKLGHHFSSMADAGKTPKCPFVSSYLLILATEQQENRGSYYQRHFCSKENLGDPYFCWKFFLLLEQWNHFSLLISAWGTGTSDRFPLFEIYLLRGKQQGSLIRHVCPGPTQLGLHCPQAGGIALLGQERSFGGLWTKHPKNQQITRWQVIPFPLLFQSSRNRSVCVVLVYFNTSLH